MAIINCVSWSPQGHEVIYAYKYPHDNLSTYTQLIVNESQTALLFSKGQLIGSFGPGKHTLSTENLPILRSLYGIPFGGKNPFTAQVWFVNLVETYSIPWKINKLSVHDADYQTNLPLEISGQYGLRVIDPERFLVKMVGTRNTFTQKDLTNQFEGEFSTKVKSAVVNYMIQNNIGYKSISAHLDEMSNTLRFNMFDLCSSMGLDMIRFYVSNIDIDTSTPEGRKVKEAIATQSSMSITGHTWQQEKMFDTAGDAISQMSGAFGGNQGGMLGGLMAIKMMESMSGGMGGGRTMNPEFDQPRFGGGQGNGGGMAGGGHAGGAPRSKTVYCSACARKFDSSMQFCPNCGNRYRPCPNCGSDNPEEARRCVNCGTPLAGAAPKCPHCHSAIPQGCTYCPGCGQPVVIDSGTCRVCGTALNSDVKFCPRCGSKR